MQVQSASTWGGEPQQQLSARFQVVLERNTAADLATIPTPAETPDFRRHVSPLLGKMGCNGRACHGSFQGQGGFRLSLFGYDFKADHDALTGSKEPRVDHKQPLASAILQKPTLQIDHEGGKRFESHGWEYRVLQKWIETGAKPLASDGADFDRLEIFPAEIVFQQPGQTAQLRVIAHWRDGSSEDVTCVARFRTNDESIAVIDERGLVTALTKGDTHVVAFYDNGVRPVSVILPVSEQANERYPQLAATTKIDELVLQKLRKLGMIPAERCTEQEFLRRVRLDLTGTLPSPSEIKQFLADSAPDKRAKKVEQLLESAEFAAWWTTRLNDLTGNNLRQTPNQKILQNDNGLYSRQWYQWLYERVKRNEPYDQIVAGMVLAISLEDGQTYEQYCQEMSRDFREKTAATFAARDSNPHYWARKNLRSAEEKTLGFAYTFMGIQIQCAQCHKHPFDQWTKQDFDQFKRFFERINYGLPPGMKDDYERMLKELGVQSDPKKNQPEYRKELQAAIAAGKTVPQDLLFIRESNRAPPRKNDQPKIDKNDKTDKTDKHDKNKNKPAPLAPVVAKLLGGDTVNVNELPDPRTALMAWLRNDPRRYLGRAYVNRVWAGYFNVGIIHPTDDANLANPPSNRPLLDYLTNGFVEHNYDMKWLHREICNSDVYQRGWQTNDTNALDTRNFSHAVPRRLPAEIAYDALLMATAGDAEREKLADNPLDRAIGLASTLSLANGKLTYPLAVFGKPDRATNCDCERSNEPSLLQSVFTQNDGEMLAQLDRAGGWLKQLEQQWRGTPGNAKQVAAKEAANPKKVEKAAKNKPAANIQAVRQNVIAQLERRIAKLLEAGKAEDAAKLLAQLKKLHAAAEKSTANPPVPDKPNNRKVDKFNLDNPDPQQPDKPMVVVRSVAPVPVNHDELIREAYLRTLSREPNVVELAKSREYLVGSVTPTAGVRDLLWALLNTKEFILNH